MAMKGAVATGNAVRHQHQGRASMRDVLKRTSKSRTSKSRFSTVVSSPQGSGDNEGDDAGTASHIPPKLQYRFRRAASLPLVEKLNSIEHDQIEMAEVKELFQTLGEVSPGAIGAECLKLMLTTLPKPAYSPEELKMCFTDVSQSNRRKTKTTQAGIAVSAETFVKALNNEGLIQMRKDRKAKKEVTRDVFVREVDFTAERDDAFRSLPLTILYMAFFLFVLREHLLIRTRNRMQESLRSWTNGRDPRTSCTKTVADMDSFWVWFLAEGLRAPFGGKNKSADGQYDQYHLASQHVLISDVRLSETHDGDQTTEWLLHSADGEEFLRNNPEQHLNASIYVANKLKNSGWAAFDVEELRFEFVTYAESETMFGVTAVSVTFGKYGDVIPVVSSDALLINIFHTGWLFVWDGCLSILVCYIFYNEAKDMYASLWVGGDSCGEYLKFWNGVDLMSIICSVAVFADLFALWLHSRAIQNIAVEGGDLLTSELKINLDVMKLSKEDVERLYDKLSILGVAFSMLHMIVGLNTVSVALKFFKAFQSNFRLRVVTDTFKEAESDFLHFLVIFGAVFLPFALVGHLLFGADISQFASLSSSLNVCLTVVLGDYSWYVDNMENIEGKLPSGTLKFVVFVWLIMFIAMVVFVLLNMFLAIVMDHYCAVSTRNKTCKGSTSIPQQVKNYYHFCMETSNFISMSVICQLLGRDDDPAHEAEMVSEDSLKEAFHGMKQEQARWIMSWLEAAEEQERKGQEAAEEHGKMMRLLQEDTVKINELNEALSLADQGEECEPAGSEELHKLAATLDELVTSMGQMDRQQYRLSKRVEQLSNTLEPITAKPNEAHAAPPGEADGASELRYRANNREGGRGEEDGRDREEGRRDRDRDRDLDRDRVRAREVPNSPRDRDREVGRRDRDRDRDRVREEPRRYNDRDR